MTTLIPKYDQGSTGAVNRPIDEKFEESISVKDFGAKGDGVTDDAPAIMAAYASIIANSSTKSGNLYFPQGTYAVGSQLDFNLGGTSSVLNIFGDGNWISLIKPTFTTGNVILVDGTPVFNMMDMGVFSYPLNRDTTAYNLYVTNCVDASVNSVAMNNALGGLFYISSTFLTMTNCIGDTNNGASGSTCLHIAGSSGAQISDCQFRVGPTSSGGYTTSKPCVLITGQATSIDITNCNFVGGGPLTVSNISGITSNSTTFTVNTSATHSFNAGDFLVLRNASVATYNSTWRITSVTSNTIIVSTLLNPGTATAVGTAESQSACFLISNANGAVNEGRISNCLFEGGQGALYGSVSLYIDGRHGTSPIEGWTVTGCYTDFGATGILLSGQASFASSQTTVFGFTIGDCVLQGLIRGLQIDQASGVSVSNCIGGTYLATQADNLGYPGYNEAILIYSSATQPYTQGISITNCVMGMGRDWSTVQYGYNHGIMLNGNTVQNLTITGNTLYGSRYAIGDTFAYYGVSYPDAIWKIENNLLENGSWPVTTSAQIIPSCTNSGTLLILPPYSDTMRVTGISSVASITPGWINDKRTLIFDTACTLQVGGNIAITATYSVLVGQCLTIVFDGTNWYVK